MMEAHHSTVAADVHREDVIQPMEAAKAKSGASVILPPTEPNVVPTIAEPSAVVPANRIVSRRSRGAIMELE